MPSFVVRTATGRLFSAESVTSAHVLLPRGTKVDGDFVGPDTVWLRVTPTTPPGAASGFMLQSELAPDVPLEPEPVDDPGRFARVVTNIARTRAADRDYLMAVAWAESAGLTKLGNPASSAIGPFHFIRSTWAGLIVHPEAPPLAFSEDDRARWIPQIEMAALFSVLMARKIAQALGRQPTRGELYFGHVFGEGAAAALLATDRDRGFAEAYSAKFGADAFEKVRNANRSVVEKDGAPRSIRGVLDELSRRLDSGYVGAAAVLDQQEADVRFLHAEPGDPPWVMVAREEAARGVFEHAGADNNSRISQYLAAAGLEKSADEVPWCGSFMAFCLKTCGDAAAAASVLPGSARAAQWLEWGKEVAPASAQTGTLIVLKPQAEGSSGHVGLLVQGAPAGKLRLLGGNQGSPQRVSSVDFDIGQVATKGFRQLG